jgi:hypothetical protein
LEPLLRQFVPGGIEKNQPHYGKKGDIMFEMEGIVLVIDVSVTHAGISGESWKKCGLLQSCFGFCSEVRMSLWLSERTCTQGQWALIA